MTLEVFVIRAVQQPEIRQSYVVQQQQQQRRPSVTFETVNSYAQPPLFLTKQSGNK